MGTVKLAISGAGAASFGFTGMPFTSSASGAVRLQQSEEQPAAARACIGQSASISAIPIGQDGPIAALLNPHPIAAEAGPAPIRTISRIPAIWNARFIPCYRETIHRAQVGQ